MTETKTGRTQKLKTQMSSCTFNRKAATKLDQAVFSRCAASLGHAFAWFGGSGAGLGSTFESTGGFEVVSSSSFEGHGSSAADPSATLEHIGCIEESSSNPLLSVLASFWKARWHRADQKVSKGDSERPYNVFVFETTKLRKTLKSI